MPSHPFLTFVGRQLTVLLRDRQLVFWNVWFFLVLLLVFVGLLSGGDRSVQVTLTASVVTTGIMANALFSIGVGLAAARERGVFRRYWLAPLPAALPVAGMLIARAVLIFAASALHISAAKILFGVPWPGGVASWAAVSALGTCAFAGIGLAIAAMARVPHVANTAANLVFIPMMALSGTALPASMMPDAWADAHWILPTAALFNGLLGSFAEGYTVIDSLPRLGQLLAWAVVPGAWGMRRWIRQGP